MFTDLAKELEKRYNVQIIIGNKKLTKPSMTVSGGFSEEQTLDEILKSNFTKSTYEMGK